MKLKTISTFTLIINRRSGARRLLVLVERTHIYLYNVYTARVFEILHKTSETAASVINFVKKACCFSYKH